jgi:hypothetical protein
MPTYKKGDLYVASVIHVARDGKNEKGEPIKVTKVIEAGQMASDTDLTAKEIEGILKRPQGKGVLRPPAFDEMQAMDTREEQRATADAVRTAEQEAADLAAEQKFEKDRLAAEQRASNEEEQRKLEAQQAKERDKVAADAQKAGAKAAAGAKK